MKNMSTGLSLLALVFAAPLFASAADEKPLPSNAPLVYVNQHIGFNVKGYKYAQKEYPCHIDKVLVEDLITRSHHEGIRLEPIGTLDKIQNGVIPVLAIDVEKLALGKLNLGTKEDYSLPMVEITAAVVKGKNNIVIAKHSCAIMTLRELSPTSDVTDLYGGTMCSATQKCLQELSRDVVDWMAPLVK